MQSPKKEFIVTFQIIQGTRAVVLLKQSALVISMPVPVGTSEEAVSALVSQFSTLAEAMNDFAGTTSTLAA